MQDLDQHVNLEVEGDAYIDATVDGGFDSSGEQNSVMFIQEDGDPKIIDSET